MPNPYKTFYLSFCDVDKPKGKQFLGAIILEASSLYDAISKAWKLKINPGGEVESWELPNIEALSKIPAHYKYKLLSKEDIGHMDEEILGVNH